MAEMLGFDERVVSRRERQAEEAVIWPEFLRRLREPL